MAIHKLATGPITLTPTSVEVTPSNFKPEQMQVAFTDQAADIRVYVNELTAMKQLARLNLTLETVIGQTIHMEQVKKDGMTYTNFSLASGVSPVAAPKDVTIAAPAASRPVDWVALATMYSECVAIAMATLGTKCEEAGIPIDASAIQAAAATLFIRASR
jgi:uncharacterized protein YcbX